MGKKKKRKKKAQSSKMSQTKAKRPEKTSTTQAAPPLSIPSNTYPAFQVPPSRWAWEKRWPWVLALFGFLLYANTLGHLYTLDDNLVIHGHKYVEQGVAGLSKIWTTPFTYGATQHNDRGYRPVVLSFFALETELFGKKAFFLQHLLHILFYVLTAWFLFWLLRRMFWKQGPLFPVVVSLLYIAHPLHTEVVANLKSLDEIFGFLFGFVLPMLLFFRFLDGQAKQHKWIALAFVSFAVGLFSKENVITYLVIIPLTLYVFSELSWRQIARWCWPLIAITAGFLWVRESVLNSYPMPTYDKMQNVLMGASSWVEQYSTAMLVMFKYLWLLSFPHPLAWDYSYKEITLVNWSDIRVLASIAIHCGMLGYALLHIRRKQVYAYAILFYLTVISVNSNLFVMTNCTLGERFLYAPSLGFAIAVTVFFFQFFQLDGRSLKAQKRAPVLWILVVVLAAYGFKTYTRNADWKDTLSLSLADVKTNPNSVRVQSTLAAVYITLAKKESDPKRRRDLYSRILPIAQKVLSIHPTHQEASYILGIAYHAVGQLNASEKAFQAHLKRYPKDVKVLNNLGGIYYFKKEYKRALSYFERFVKLHPKDAKAINNLGVITLHQLKDPDGAMRYFQRAIRIQPSYGEPYKRMGDAWARKGKLFKAIGWFRKAAQVEPKRWGHLLKNLGPFLRQNWRAPKNFKRLWMNKLKSSTPSKRRR